MSISRQNKNTKHGKDAGLHVRLQRKSFRRRSSELTEKEWEALTDAQKVAMWVLAANRTMQTWQKVAETLAERLGDVEYAYIEYGKISEMEG